MVRKRDIVIWEAVCNVHQEGILLEIEHVKAHRSKKEKQDMSLFFDSFCTEGNERADEPAKDGAIAVRSKPSPIGGGVVGL